MKGFVKKACLSLLTSTALFVGDVYVVTGNLFSLTAQAQTNNYLILVNGNRDCCAGNMGRVRRYAQSAGMEIIEVTWSNFKEGWRSGTALTDEGKRRFVNSGKNYLRKLPTGSNIYMVGHSWGGDSALRLVREYNDTNVNFRLLALIDPVGPGGMRGNLLGNTVPSKVDYFLNRWQTNEPFPNDFLIGGKISCQAKQCDQSEQSTHKNEDGSSVKVTCGWHEFGCSDRRENPLNPYPGNRMKRASHSGLATDGWVEASINRIIDNLMGSTPPPSNEQRIAQSSSSNLVMFETRKGYWFNSEGSTGNVSAIPNANLNPDVSDEIFRIHFK